MPENEKVHVHEDDTVSQFSLRGADATYRAGRGEHFRRCSWCGSVHPQDLIAARAADEVRNIDRSVDWKYGWPHKIYLDIANQDPEARFVVGGTSGGAPKSDDELRAEGYTPRHELTAADFTIAKRDGWGELENYQGVKFGTRASHHAKFYSVHTLEPFLSDDERYVLFSLIGYTFERVDDGRIRWQRFDYGAAEGGDRG